MVTTINFLYNVHSLETACNFKTVSEEESVQHTLDTYKIILIIMYSVLKNN